MQPAKLFKKKVWLNRKMCTGWNSEFGEVRSWDLWFLLPAVGWLVFNDHECCKLKFNCSSKDWLKCFLCLWQVLIFSGQISGFLVDFDIQKHSPFISWQCKERWFKSHFSPPFQILSGTRNIYTQLKQKNKKWTSLFKNFCFSLPALSLAIFLSQLIQSGFPVSCRWRKVRIRSQTYRLTHVSVQKSLYLWKVWDKSNLWCQWVN